MVDLDTEKARCAVDLVRSSMESYVANGTRERPGCMEEAFYERRGALVKLESTRGRRRVRGQAACYTRNRKLSDAIVEAAIKASDPNSGRSEVRKCEIDDISVTLCVLDSVESVDDSSEVSVGRHGVIVRRRDRSGWMLPTMPVQHGWSADEFLDRACCKAGLDRGEWMNNCVSIKAFEGQIFRETEPGGDVEEVGLVGQKA